MSNPGGRHGDAFNAFYGTANNIVQAHHVDNVNFTDQQRPTSRFAGDWQEDFASTAGLPSLTWNLRLNGSFTARPVRTRSWTNYRMRLVVAEWSGQWRVSFDDPSNPWMELVATDLASPALGLASSLLRQPQYNRQTLERLTRSANITSHTQEQFTLSWIGNDNIQVTSTWKRL